MLKKVLLLIWVAVIGLQDHLKAAEGMWLPQLLKKLNEADMQREGLKLSADDLYSINHSSMKDAIVRLGGGFCSAEMISPEGLMLTNHHCAYEAVQELSSIDHDYLTNGFWAKSREEELACPGLTASFLVRIEDVTDRINRGLNDTLTESQRTAAIQKLFTVIISEVSDSNGYKAEVKSFFKENAFYLFLYKVYKDVRLVGAPPSSIGKFGGDSDNWMWPRHTGDFSLFRVYMSNNGKPAEYSKDNVPFKPQYFLPVSMEGFKKDDFAITMGYPGKTDRYLSSEGVRTALEQTNPAIIKIRERKLSILKEDMDVSAAIRIKYAAKYYESSNYYKYFIGQSKGLTRMKIVEKKQQEESDFKNWANADLIRKKKYATILDEMKNNYSDLRKYNLSRVYFNEAIIQGAEINLKVFSFRALDKLLENKDTKAEDIKAMSESLKTSGQEFFKNYNAVTDQKLFAALLKMYFDFSPREYQPALFSEIENKYKGDFKKYAEMVYKKTLFADSSKYFAFLDNPSLKQLKKDPAFIAITGIIDNYQTKVQPFTKQIDQKLNRGYRYYVAGLQEMYSDRKFYPDANGTMRLSYGKVADYFPMDGVYYNYYTTLEGVMEKRDTSVEDYKVPARLEELYRNKDYGRYGVNGQMTVCFITTNDITGGSSGSPVINGKGELIGLSFDGNWEAMSGDIAFDPVYKRSINVDIRYILFIIDKFAGASNLINEMKIIGDVKADQHPVPVHNEIY